jgi:hypothetical protein
MPSRERKEEVRKKASELLARLARPALERGEGRQVSEKEVLRMVDFLLVPPEDAEDFALKTAVLEALRRDEIDMRWNAKGGPDIRLKLPPGMEPPPEEPKRESGQEW